MPNPDYNEKVESLFPMSESEKQEEEFKKKLIEEVQKRLWTHDIKNADIAFHELIENGGYMTVEQFERFCKLSEYPIGEEYCWIEEEDDARRESNNE